MSNLALLFHMVLYVFFFVKQKKMIPILLLLGISFLANLLATVTVWPTQFEDVRISLNDIYTALYATGWFFTVDGIAKGDLLYASIGLVMIACMYIALKYQLFITTQHYAWSMMSYHSMELNLSQRLSKKHKDDSSLLDGFVEQKLVPLEREVEYLKTL